MAALQAPPLAADAVSQALSGFTGWLATPVHAGMLVLLAVLAYETGRALTEFWRRVRPSAVSLQELTQRALRDPSAAGAIARRAPGPLAERTVLELATAVAATAPGDDAAEATEQALARYELAIQRRLDRTRILVRAGPALGLMGTLIPLAPGLLALGDGDIKTLAADLQVAFAATVTGILVGMVAFVLTLYRTRVYTEDLAAFEHAIAAHDPAAPPHHRVAESVGVHTT